MMSRTTQSAAQSSTQSSTPSSTPSSRQASVQTQATKAPPADPTHKRMRGKHHVLLVGQNQRTAQFLENALAAESSKVRVTGILDCADEVNGSTAAVASSEELLVRLGVPHVGKVSDLEQYLRHHPVDEVVVTLPIKSCYDDIAWIIEVCELAGVPVSVCGDLFKRRVASMKWVGERIHFSCAQRTLWSRFLKRTMDIVGASIALSIFAIPMLLTAIAVKLTSRGSVFFRQERSGLNHQPFSLYKFRTMVANAEQLKADLEAGNEMDGPVFKIKKDPRLTRIGSFLRKFSLDELPQLINVLKGDMSLVGPRPPLGKEVADYEWWQRRRLSTRPGITCIWQVSGRNEISFAEWMKLDLEYIDNWSVMLDVKLLAKTLPAVLFARGAC